MIITFITAIYIVLFLVIIINQIVNIIVYGRIIKDDLVIKALDKAYNDGNGISLNRYDNTILNIGMLPFISTHFDLFSRYYIDGVGQISRFGKAHKRIKHTHNLLKGTREQRIKRKLNIN